MAIDPNIALQFKGIDVGQILQQAQQAKQRRMEMQNQQYLMDRRHSDDARSDQYRGALGDVLTGNGSFDPSQPAAPSAPASAMNGGMSGAEQRAARADPEAFLTFQGKRLDIKADQLKQYKDLNDTAMQLLSGVHDDASLQAAKAQAHQLYTANGQDPSFIDQIPDQYSPEVVRDLEMKGMSTANQLLAVARENRLNLDASNIEADNQRADQAQTNLNAYRQQRLQSQQRTQDLLDARTRRGQDMSSADRKAAIQQRAEAAKSRGTGKPAAVSAGDGAIIKNPKTGQRMQLKNGQWVAIP